MALPFLEIMLPFSASAATGGAPQRFVAVHFGNGILQNGAPNTSGNGWECTGDGANFQLSRCLQPLAPHKDWILPLKGITNDGYEYCQTVFSQLIAHWGASPAFLTGQAYDFPNRTRVTQLLNDGASLDQMIGATMPTVKKTLVMGGEPTTIVPVIGGDGADSLVAQISWSSKTVQTPRLDTSAQVFDFLFGNGVPSSVPVSTRRLIQKTGIMDDVKEDAKKLMSTVGASDKSLLDQFFTFVSELEKKIKGEMSSASSASCTPTDPKYKADTNTYTTANYEQRCRNMADMIAIAFQCDITRVVSHMLSNESSYLPVSIYSGAPGESAQHNIGHWFGPGYVSEYSRSQMEYMNLSQARQFAYILERLKTTNDAYGPLLENTLLMFGCGMGDAPTHNRENIAMILAGHGGNTVTNRLVNFGGAKHSNLLATIAGKFGLPAKIGLSNGTLSGI